MFGSCDQEIPGQNLVFPNSGSDILHKELNILDLKKSYLKHFKNQNLSNKDYVYLKEELNLNVESIIKMMEEINES
jgi:hypothetical protein